MYVGYVVEVGEIGSGGVYVVFVCEVWKWRFVSERFVGVVFIKKIEYALFGECDEGVANVFDSVDFCVESADFDGCV